VRTFGLYGLGQTTPDESVDPLSGLPLIGSTGAAGALSNTIQTATDTSAVNAAMAASGQTSSGLLIGLALIGVVVFVAMAGRR
jgi:hypothetical protein